MLTVLDRVECPSSAYQDPGKPSERADPRLCLIIAHAGLDKSGRMKWLVDAAVATALLLCLIAQDEIGISVCRGYGSVLIADEIQTALWADGPLPCRTLEREARWVIFARKPSTGA